EKQDYKQRSDPIEDGESPGPGAHFRRTPFSGSYWIASGDLYTCSPLTQSLPSRYRGIGLLFCSACESGLSPLRKK
ncbi:MAG TPA: hypothetical protein VK518_11865, partial [Puia sp.]|nr:hypothetical protein [Puia sp.]